MSSKMDHLDIAIYINDLEDAMYEWDDGPVSWQLELEKVRSIIKQLMDDTFNEPDPIDRTILALLNTEQGESGTVS